jgi:hypothetical protein
VAVKTLFDALKECLQDPQKASFYEAKVVREMILADGEVSLKERMLLEEALHGDKFDEKAVTLLSQLLLRANLQSVQDSKDHKGQNCC